MAQQIEEVELGVIYGFLFLKPVLGHGAYRAAGAVLKDNHGVQGAVLLYGSQLLLVC